MGNWIEIFKAGTHTDSAGNVRTWTEADLDKIVSSYDPAKHEAPVVIGHPKDNAPAFAWVEGLKRVGKSLFYMEKASQSEFDEMRQKGLFKKRSLSLYPDGTLRHVGWLGAMPPAVKGLADVAFADGEGTTIEFSDSRMWIVGRVLQRLRDWLIEKEGVDVADKIVDSWMINDLNQIPAEDVAGVAAPAFSDAGTGLRAPTDKNNKGGEGEMDKVKELEEKLRLAEGRAANFAEKEQEAADLRKELEAERKKSRTQEFSAFCENLVKEGKLLPAMKPKVLDFMEILHGQGSFCFSEGGEKPALAEFQEMLKAMPKVVEFEEVATAADAAEGNPKGEQEFSGNVDADRMALHTKALEYMEQHKGVEYLEAVQNVINSK